MGLSSLPVLNKLGLNSFWLNTIQPNKSWLNELSNISTIELILKRLTEERFFYNYFFIQNTLLFKNINAERSYPVPKTIQYNTYIGETWFLHYSNTLLISPFYFNSSMLNEKKIKVRVQPCAMTLFYLEYYNFFN